MNKKCYIATSLDNFANHNKVRDAIIASGDSLTYDWTTHGSVQLESRDRLKEVALREADGVINANYVIVLLPGGRGTHTELGIALGLRKTVYLVGFDSNELTCVFYHHPLVIRYKVSIDEFCSIITRNSNSNSKIHRDLHGEWIHK